MILQYEYSTRVSFTPSVGRHNILLRCLPAVEPWQRRVGETFCISDDFKYKEGLDGLGNRIISGSTDERHTALEYTSHGLLECSTYCTPDALCHPVYRMPSQLTMPTEDMRALLPVLSGLFLDDCLAIAHAVHRYVVYTPGVTGMLTTASDVMRHRKGVCQDYAHLMTALCRMAGMPARYVCGFMKGEGQTHAWVEVHDGQCWYAFDPTNDTAVASGYIKLAHGRDALDCPVSRGTYLGVSTEETFISVKVQEK